MEIKFDVTLDKSGSPETMTWMAEGAEADAEQKCKSIMISIWDQGKNHTVRFDLWTKDMMQNEMNAFVFESLLMLGDAYQKATGNQQMADDIRSFAESFGIKNKVIRKVENQDSSSLKPFRFDFTQ